MPIPATGPDLSSLEACSLLTAEQQVAIGVEEEGRPYSTVGGSNCAWFTAVGTITVLVDPATNLSAQPFRWELLLGDHRAWVYRTFEGCKYTLAVSMTSTVSVGLHTLDQPAEDTCARGLQVALIVSSNLPTG